MKLILIVLVSLTLLGSCFAWFYTVETRNKSNVRDIEKTSYCKIDSIYSVFKNDFTSEVITKYHTNCEFIFSSYNTYIVGDSIEVKTIIIQ